VFLNEYGNRFEFSDVIAFAWSMLEVESGDPTRPIPLPRDPCHHAERVFQKSAYSLLDRFPMRNSQLCVFSVKQPCGTWFGLVLR
jgi:hypothetical protein